MEHRFGFVFSKEGDMIYISHLDLVRLLMRAARRADLPVALTKGFHPHFKIKLQRALKLGLSSDREEGEIVLSHDWEPEQIKRSWQEQLPAGITIKEVGKIA